MNSTVNSTVNSTIEESLDQVKEPIKFYPVTYEVFTGSRFKKCSLKKRFAIKKEAKTFMYHHNVQKYIAKRLTVYKCRFCGFYHIGGIENMIEFNKLIDENLTNKKLINKKLINKQSEQNFINEKDHT